MLKSVCASLVLAILCSLASSNVVAQSEPFRLGFLTVRTGALAAGGKQMEEGILLFLKERNYMLAGRNHRRHKIPRWEGGPDPRALHGTGPHQLKNFCRD